MAARSGPRKPLDPVDFLEAVSALGIRWTLLFADELITSVNEVLDLQLFNGNMRNAYTLSPRGERVLLAARPDHRATKLEVTEDLGCPECRLTDTCWTITCTRCRTVAHRHVPGFDVADSTLGVLRDHVCSSVATIPPARRNLLDADPGPVAARV